MRTKIVRFRNPPPETEPPPAVKPPPDAGRPAVPEGEETVIPPPLPVAPLVSISAAPPELPPPLAPPPPVETSAEDEYATEVFDWTRLGFPPGSPEPPSGWLVIVKGAGKGRVLPVGYGTHSIGRGEGERIRLNFGDRSISRQNHFQITYDPLGRNFYVSQGTSPKFAHVNGQPILQSIMLKTGDRLRVGDTELAFVAFCGASFDWQVT